MPRRRTCAKCMVGLYPFKNGVHLIVMANNQPYKIWAADVWACRQCGAQVIVGFSSDCYERFDDAFEAMMNHILSNGQLGIDYFYQYEEST